MFLFLFMPIAIFNFVSTLQCTDNCSMSYSLDQPFILPRNCMTSSSWRCTAKLTFWFNRHNYTVTFPGEINNDPTIGDSKQFIMIETAKTKFFSYDIDHTCADTDDCARQFIEMKVLEMRQRPYNLSTCFDTNDAVRQCAVSGMIGACQIIDDLIKYKLHRRSCQRSHHESASVNIYDSGTFAMMTVKCNRMLCNGPLTIEAVKKVLHKHNITTVSGRLPGASSHMSLKFYFVLLMLFFSSQLS
ncbi:unnamed protein product [Adineta ricciae]|uniref:Uncharacterized protein n=1 Tax=Adineta ricciae TaxID=249248 RepID=A0A814P8M8_ADIRI|nr:unnamed protein product [Adineta ricciae]